MKELAGLEGELEGEELGESEPAYLKPASLPVQPTILPNAPATPARAAGTKVDEYGLPMNA